MLAAEYGCLDVAHVLLALANVYVQDYFCLRHSSVQLLLFCVVVDMDDFFLYSGHHMSSLCLVSKVLMCSLIDSA